MALVAAVRTTVGDDPLGRRPRPRRVAVAVQRPEARRRRLATRSPEPASPAAATSTSTSVSPARKPEPPTKPGRSVASHRTGARAIGDARRGLLRRCRRARLRRRPRPSQASSGGRPAGGAARLLALDQRGVERRVRERRRARPGGRGTRRWSATPTICVLRRARVFSRASAARRDRRRRRSAWRSSGRRTA